MAKQKQSVLIKSSTDTDRFVVWIDEAERWKDEIKSTEGVCYVMAQDTRIDVFIDPRYSKDEIAKEIKQLLIADVPKIFKEM